MGKQNVVYPYSGILFSQKKEWSTDICIKLINLKNSMEMKDGNQKDYDSIHGRKSITGKYREKESRLWLLKS